LAGSSQLMAAMTARMVAVTGGAENAAWDWYIARSGTLTQWMTLGRTGLGINQATPASRLDVNGSVSVARAAKTTTYTISDVDFTVVADATGGAFTVTLPTAVGISGRIHVIKRINSAANNVTVG